MQITRPALVLDKIYDTIMASGSFLGGFWCAPMLFISLILLVSAQGGATSVSSSSEGSKNSTSTTTSTSSVALHTHRVDVGKVIFPLSVRLRLHLRYRRITDRSRQTSNSSRTRSPPKSVISWVRNPEIQTSMI